MDVNSETVERLLLRQQLQGHPHLRFKPEIEQMFARDRFRFMQRHWGARLVIAVAVLFQLVYAVHDLFFLSPGVNQYLLPLRLTCVAAILGSWLYFRREESEPRIALRLFAGAYFVCGVSVVLLIYASQMHGEHMPYEGLLLLLVFAYVMLYLPWRSALLTGWTIWLLFAGLGAWVNPNKVELGYQLLFLACINVIGCVGCYLQEHAYRSAWLNQRLLRIARQRSDAETQSRLRQLAAVSHDLRQPLNAMGLYAQHLQECSEEQEVQRISAQLSGSVEQLSRMLNSLLDYNRLTLTGALQTQPVSVELRPMLQRLINELESVNTGSLQVSLECPADVWVRSDSPLLERLLRNLLTNAYKHAQASHIWLKAKVHDGIASVEVGDNGVGLAADQHELVFEEFRQLPSNVAKEPGLGLGLAIVRQLARLLEHPLQLLSAPGLGARFIVQLPVGEAQAVEVAATETAKAGKILLLEDDAASRESLEGLLVRWGSNVQSFAEAEQALAHVQAFEPDLLISDYRLGNTLNGLQVLEQMRERCGQMLPALLITAEVSPELQRQCAQQSVQLLAKPLLPARLRQATNQLLSKAEA